MSFFKRALVTIKKQKIKNLSFFLLIFVMGNLLAGAIIVQEAVKNIEHKIRANTPAIATVEAKHYSAYDQYYQEHGEHVGWYTYEDLLKVNELPYVKEFNLYANVSLIARDWEYFIDEREGNIWTQHITYGELQLIDLMGVTNLNLFIENGAFNLNAGRLFTQEELSNGHHVMLVSQEIANLNNLTIGSMVTFENIIFDYYEYFATGKRDPRLNSSEEHIYQSFPYVFEVIGILQPLHEFTGGITASETDDIIWTQLTNNRLFIPLDLQQTISEEFRLAHYEMLVHIEEELGVDADSEMWTYIDTMDTPIYLLNDPLDFEAFAEAANEILPTIYEILNFSEEFKYITKGMETFLWLADITFWITILASIIILALISMLFLRDRKIELGIYLALGEKKGQIYSQFLTEVFIIALLGITVSIFSGEILADKLSRSLLVTQLESQQLEELNNSVSPENNALYQLRNAGIFHSFSIDEVIENYHISLNAHNIATIYGVAFLTILVANLAPLIYITKLKPRKILLG